MMSIDDFLLDELSLKEIFYAFAPTGEESVRGRPFQDDGSVKGDRKAIRTASVTSPNKCTVGKHLYRRCKFIQNISSACRWCCRGGSEAGDGKRISPISKPVRGALAM